MFLMTGSAGDQMGAFLAPAESRDKQTPSQTYRNRSSVIREGLNKNHCYDDLCFGVFALSVEISPAAAGGTCVS
jgi:hypothetical protein